PRLGKKLLRRFDVLANIDAGESPGVPMVDRDVEPGLHALGHFAAPIGGKRLEQCRQEIRALGEHLVVERHGTREVALAARFRRLYAQQAHDVDRVGVIFEPSIGLVVADRVDELFELRGTEMPYPVITASEPAPVPCARTSDRLIMHPGRIAAMKRLVLALIATYACSALPQGYPSKPISFVIPFAAGGDSDLSGRNVAQHASKYLNNVPIVPVNRSGASGAIATLPVNNAPPPAHTLLVAR